MKLLWPNLTLSVLLLLSSLACVGSSPFHSANGNQWQPHRSIPGVLRRDLVGDPARPGPFKYQLKITAGTRVAAHQHSKDVNVKVVSGSMFIIIGEPLESSRVQHFEAGSGFVVPAHAWHDEWWDEETVLEAEGGTTPRARNPSEMRNVCRNPTRFSVSPCEAVSMR